MVTKPIPKNLQRAIFASNRKVELSTNMNIDARWVEENLIRLLNICKRIDSMEDLTKLDDDSLRPSAAISNCLASLLRQRNLNFSKNKKLIRRVLKSYLEVYSAATRMILETNTDLGVVFNGRFLHERACWDALKALEIPTLIFEVTRDRYFLRPEGFHSSSHNQQYIEEFWRNSDGTNSERAKNAARYFAQLRYGNNPFIMASEKTLSNLGSFFVFFANSDDESFGFWDNWEQPLGSQLDVIRGLQRLFDERSKERLVIRLHPNFANKSLEEKQIWSSIKGSPYSQVIGFDEKVSSYSLMAAAKGILTYGSTIGLEAAYWKKPVAVLADCHYDKLGVADKVTDWVSLRSWIESNYKLKDRELRSRHLASYKKPWYLSHAGERLLDCQVKEIGEPGWGSWEATTFRGIRLKRTTFQTKLSRLTSKIVFLANQVKV